MLAAPSFPPKVYRAMHILFGIAAVVFIVLGFVGIIGGFSLIFWPIAAVCIALAIKFYPRDRKGPKAGPEVRSP